MTDTTHIHSDQEYSVTLERIEQLMNAEAGTPQGDELDKLTDLVWAYEGRHFPMDAPSVIAVAEFMADQQEKDR